MNGPFAGHTMEKQKLEPLLKDLRRRLRAALGERLREALLYGSHARGEATPASDVDVLVVVDGEPDRALRDALSEIRQAMYEAYREHVYLHLVAETRFDTQDQPLFRNVRREAAPLSLRGAPALRARLQATAPAPTYTDSGMKEVTEQLLGRARTRLSTAQHTLHDLSDVNAAISAAYYAAYYAATAALNEAGREAQSHKGTHDLFFKTYVHDGGPLSREVSGAFSELQEKRVDADYEPMPGFSADDAEALVARAETFVDAVEDVLQA